MKEKQFKLSSETVLQYQIMDNDTDLNENEVVDLLNYQERLIEEQHDEIINWTKKYVGIKKENEQLQEKIEMDKNDFFISEAKRMRLLAFIEDNGLRKEYYEWERRIYDERARIEN